MPELEKKRRLVRDYREAEAAFQAATAVLNAHIANRTKPTDDEIVAEEDARARLVAARKLLYKD
jgi:hypothetical protein